MYPTMNGCLFWLLVFVTGYHRIEGTEYCWEDFRANCSQHEVIVMQKADYGRMQLGRCITMDYYMGCQSDVIKHMDRKCSGRHTCMVHIPDTDLQRETGCRRDLVAYLNATYACVPVERPKGETKSYCSPEQTVIETKSVGYISSLVSIDTSAGTRDCPWVISVPKGQKVNVTLLDFSVNQRATQAEDMCARYATIREIGNPEILVCGGESRTEVAHVSDTNTIQIEINSALALTKPDMPYFVLKFEAVGCPDMVAPAGGWLERRDNKMAMGCNGTGDTRHLVCSGDKWVGVISNCSESLTTSTKDAQGFIRNEVPFGLVLAIVIGVILGIIIGSLLLGIVLYTQNKLKKRNRDADPGSQGGISELEKTQILQSGNYGYAHVWELQQLRQGSDGPGTDTHNTIRTTNVCPVEFGSHLGKPPGYPRNAKDHSYESPRFTPAGGHIHTMGGAPRHIHGEQCTGTMSPKCHEFDVHIKTTLAGANNAGQRQPDSGSEARYTD